MTRQSAVGSRESWNETDTERPTAYCPNQTEGKIP
jgi:hypothetical protein